MYAVDLYLRILRYLRPHLGVFLVAVGATFAFAGLDAFTYVLLIPFVGALFGESDASDLPGGGGGTGPDLTRNSAHNYTQIIGFI